MCFTHHYFLCVMGVLDAKYKVAPLIPTHGVRHKNIKGYVSSPTI